MFLAGTQFDLQPILMSRWIEKAHLTHLIEARWVPYGEYKLPPVLTKSRSHKKLVSIDPIALKFDRLPGMYAAQASAKFQGDD